MLDLKYTYTDYGAGSASGAPETAGTVILISGCMDAQMSAEASIGGGKVSGAMTWSLLQSLKGGDISWSALLTNMRKLLNESGFNQIPQLSSGRPLDTSTRVLFC